MATRSKAAAAKSAATAQESNLKFHNTYSVGEFRKFFDNRPLDVVAHPKTGHIFFACGQARGLVAKEIDLSKECAVSEVEREDGTHLFLLHNRKADNVLMSFND